jgi:predicted flap endonuclease-1-like 5' DNA nuclease
MWFLLLQIFVFMLLAAILGAALAWWWMKRHYEDITESHDALIAQSSKLSMLPTKEDLRDAVNFEPVNDRIAKVEAAIAGLRFPQTDLSPLHERLRALEARLSAFTLEPVTTQVSNLAGAVSRIPAPDLRPIDERLSRIENVVRGIAMPEVDLGPVHSGIATLGLNIEPVQARIGRLETQINELAELLDSARRSDNEAIAGRLISLTSTVTALRMPDIAPLQERLAALETSVNTIKLPETDLAPVHASIADLGRTIATLKMPETDLGPLHNRFFQIQSAIGAIQQELANRTPMQDIDKRLGAQQEQLYSLTQTDLSPVLGIVHSIDSRLDLEATENRLTAIEYGLAAVHHMLRSRPDPAQRAALADQTRPESRTETRNGYAEPPARPEPRPAPPPPPAPPRPAWEQDPINTVRRPGDHANLLTEPAFGPADNLETLNGVGPMLAALLHDIGVFYFWQVAEWTPEEVAWVESKLLHFRGRITRDDWVGHARTLTGASTAARRPMGYTGRL